MSQKSDDWAAIVYFLLWYEQHDPNAMWGGYWISEVVESLARRLHVTPEKLRELLDNETQDN